MLNIFSIVEGRGEVEAVPVLVRRIAAENGLYNIKIQAAYFPKGSLVRGHELGRAMNLAALHVGRAGGVLIFVDTDDDDPTVLGPQLLAQATFSRPDIPCKVILAKREYEAWFLAAAESLRGRRGLSMGLEAPEDPERIRDAKSWLTRHMSKDAPYSPTLHQAALTETFDFSLAKRACSFDRCYNRISELLNQIASQTDG
jgi:hypothetical protein